MVSTFFYGVGKEVLIYVRMKKLYFLALVAMYLPMIALSQSQHAVKKLEVTAEPGVMIGLQEGGISMFTISAGVGSWLDENFYLGLHTGAIIPFKDGVSTGIPISARMEYKFDGSQASGFSLPFDAGYVFKHETVNLGLVPTYTLGLNSWSNLKIGVGYVVSLSTHGYNPGHSAVIRLGLQMHTNDLQPKPTRDSGLQYSLDGGIAGADQELGYQLGLALLYKYNPHISFGVQLAYEEYEFYYNMLSYGLRGQYRLSDKRNSWFANVDLGFNSVFDYDETLPYVLPAIGYSWQIAGNSYLNVSGGYRFGKKFLTNSEYDIKGTNSGPFIKLSWTHTTGLLSRNK